MRFWMCTLSLAAVLSAALILAGCGSQGIDRIDVTWLTDPPPRWGLYPGYRQEIPCPKGSAYSVDVYRTGKPFTGGTVADMGFGLLFKAAAGSRDIEAETPDRDHMNLYATLRDEKGASQRVLALRVERKGDKIYFEFPK